MSNFLNEMHKESIKAKSSIDNAFDALSYIDSDFKYFLNNFFKDDINKNLLLTQIFYEDNDGAFRFQSVLFEKAALFFKKMFSIDGLSFYYDARLPLSSMDLILSDTKIASINIFYKQLVLYEGVFFENIDKGIEDKSKERDALVDKYNAKVMQLNNFSVLSKEQSDGFAKSVVKNTVFKKQTKKERLTDLESLNFEIISLEDEISELIITKQMLIKNLSNIKYFQEKIENRINSNLDYRVIIN